MGVCPATGEACPIDHNFDLLAESVADDPASLVALTSIKNLVDIKRQQGQCYDGPVSTTHHGEVTVHCNNSNVPAMVRVAKDMAPAYGLPDEMMEVNILYRRRGI